ncbi:ribosome maturation factor RimP [Chondromyces crocatus]|uniref:Ribosome maturation factor RimP n=1 Tax=Chondromyces crocatus TaxID=52 RepID=A0A0K1ED23_CHOCO|nr:ribosome maturation factor RimP [Chondromyces crocatus]AKT38744.1 uncharacterized protein CMC5_028890 [Chondromyces crocatus]
MPVTTRWIRGPGSQFGNRLFFFGVWSPGLESPELDARVERGHPKAIFYFMQHSMGGETKGTVDLARVREAITPALVAYGVQLVDAEWLTERAGWTLRVTIEREGVLDLSGGVTLEDCAEVSRDVSAALDVADLISCAYNLEVSSPGLDRRLKSPAEFKRFVGRTAKVKLSRPASDGQKLLRGELLEAPEGLVAVMVDGKRIEAAIEDIAEARLVFELTPQPKAGKKGRRRPSGQAEGTEQGAQPATPGPRKRP